MMASAFKVIAEEVIRKAERVPCSRRDLVFGLNIIAEAIQERLVEEAHRAIDAVEEE